MADIFLGTEVEPSAFEIALQQITLSGLEQRIAETGDFSSAVNAALGFKRDADGNFVRLTEQERFDSLGPVEQQTFNLFKQQVSRLESAFAGEPSELIKEQDVRRADILQEQLTRFGGSRAVSRSDTERGVRGLVGGTTPGIQSVQKNIISQNIREDEFRRNEINQGFANVFSGGGLLDRFNTQNIANLTNAPSRFDVFSGGGLLANAGAASRFDAQQQSDFFGSLLDPSLAAGGEFLKKLIF